MVRKSKGESSIGDSPFLHLYSIDYKRSMFRAFASSIKQFVTATVLLLLVMVALEIALQLKSPLPSATVSTRVAPTMQSLLAPSSTTHHEMLRLSEWNTTPEISVKTNSLGLRGPEPSRPKPAGLLRIVLLGDETILGPQLEAQHTVAARLQQFLSGIGVDVEVINAGVPGYCPLLSGLQFQHELQALEPDLVILHFDMNDVADDAVYRRSLKQAGEQQICVNRLVTANQRAPAPATRLLRGSALLRLMQAETGFSAQGAGAFGMADVNERYTWTTAARTDRRLQIQHALTPIDAIANGTQQKGGRFLVASAPTPWQVAASQDFPELAKKISTNADWPLVEDFPFQILDAACERSAIPFCDATAGFRSFSQPEKLFMKDSTDLSAYGSALYAREIASMLLRDANFAGLFSPRSNVTTIQPPLN